MFSVISYEYRIRLLDLSASQDYTMSATIMVQYRGIPLIVSDRHLLLLAQYCREYTPKHARNARNGAISRLPATFSSTLNLT